MSRPSLSVCLLGLLAGAVIILSTASSVLAYPSDVRCDGLKMRPLAPAYAPGQAVSLEVTSSAGSGLVKKDGSKLGDGAKVSDGPGKKDGAVKDSAASATDRALPRDSAASGRDAGGGMAGGCGCRLGGTQASTGVLVVCC